jgi:S1-C subfamily serine protease
MADRLWRHPSELGLHATAGPRIVLHKRPSHARVLVAAALGLIGGTVVGIGALVASGSLDDSTQTTAVEQLAQPMQRVLTGGELAIAAQALPAVARIDTTGPGGTRAASGVVVRDDGLMITTSDVLDGAVDVTVTLDDGTIHQADVVGRDRRSDIGVININATGLPVVALPDATVDEAIGFGDQVVVVDTSPADQPSPLVTSGFVSVASTMVRPSPDLASTDAGSNPMYGLVEVQVGPDAERPVGGAILLDGNGSLVGIVTARTPAATAETMFDELALYATPYDHARRVYEQVVRSGSYTQAALPVDVKMLDSDRADELDLERGGLLVRSEPTNPLVAASGLRQGDIIVAINGTPISDSNDKWTQVRRFNPGETVEIRVLRSGAMTNLTATLSAETSVP